MSEFESTLLENPAIKEEEQRVRREQEERKKREQEAVKAAAAGRCACLF